MLCDAHGARGDLVVHKLKRESELGCANQYTEGGEEAPPILIYVVFTGEPLYVGMDLTIASFDSISEVNMVSI